MRCNCCANDAYQGCEYCSGCEEYFRRKEEIKEQERKEYDKYIEEQQNKDYEEWLKNNPNSNGNP